MASKKALMIQRTHEYLALHRKDPAGYPLTVEAVAAFVPVARRLFYKDDPEIASLLDLIRRSPEQRPMTTQATADEPEVGELDDATLEGGIARVIARAVWAMQKYVGHHKGPNAAAEAALAAHDLDEVLGVLSGCQKALRPLVAEYETRRRASARMHADGKQVDAQPSLFT